MTSTTHGRPVALGMVAAMLATIALVNTGAAAHAEDFLLEGVPMPVPAADVTETDSDLGSAMREVVVIVDGPQGPEVSKLRTRSQSEALRLVDGLNARAGVTAEVNQVLEVPQEPVAVADGPHKDAGQFAIPTSGMLGTKAVLALGAEQFGGVQWGLAAVHAESAWQVTRGSGVTVAVVDSGVDATHPDLADRVLPQIDLVDDPWTGDPTGHGTHVAGIIAASLDGSGVAGLANEVTILPVRVMDASGAGDFLTVASGVIEAVNAGAQVINLSVGGPYSPVVAEAVQYAVASGVTVVAAVGNEYAESNPTTYPAALPDVVGVSSISPEGTSSVFANSGSYVDIAAPGEDILSTVPGGGWEYSDGTSMAAPFVSATAALVRVANPTLGRAQVDSILLSTTVDDSDGDGRDNWFGEGILQADLAALAAATSPGGLSSPAVTTKVKAVGGRSKLRVDVNPNKSRGFWTFQVQMKVGEVWVPQKTYKTLGSKETRTVNLRKGTYRVVVNPKYGYRGIESAAVSLKR